MYNEKMIEQGRGRGVLGGTVCVCLCVCVCVCVCAARVCRDFEYNFYLGKNSSAAERKCEYHR